MGVVVILENPFNPAQRRIHTTRRPVTVRRWLHRRKIRAFAQPTICFVNGGAVLRKDWATTTIGADDVVTFAPLPAGKASGKILMVVVAIATIFITAGIASALTPALGALGAKLVAGLVGLALNAIVSMLVPPPKAKGGGFSDAAQASPTYSLQAQGNQARLGQPIPVLYGRHVVFPDFAARPYQRFVNNEQYLHYLLVITQGRCDVETVRIGETPVSSFQEVEWQKVEPGAAVPTAIVDPKVVVCPDLAEVELLDSAQNSPWRGPFAINPPGTAIATAEYDIAAPRGLYHANNAGGLDAKSFTVEFDIRLINDLGEPLGGWISLAPLTGTHATLTPQRWTHVVSLPEPGRWETRMRRTDLKDTSAQSGHMVVWFGLRGIMTAARTFPGVTLLAMKLRASSNLTDSSSRQVNVIATRRLPTFDPVTGGPTVGDAPSRAIADAFADINLNAAYGAKLDASEVDLAGLYANHAAWQAAGISFDGIFDTSVTAWEALSRAGRLVQGVPVLQAGKVCLVVDAPSAVPIAMFTPRNIARNSFEVEYKMPDDDTADAVTVEYVDPVTWKPAEVTMALPGSAMANPARVPLFGCTVRAVARAYGWRLASVNRYRRRIVTWRTEMEGLAALYGDPIACNHDLPAWGQAAEAVAFDPDTRLLRVSVPLEWTSAPTHYVSLRAPDGHAAGPFEAYPVVGDPYHLFIGDGVLPVIHIGSDRERTHVAFGGGENWAARLKLIAMRPRGAAEIELQAVDDDPRVYDPVPAEVVT